MKKFLTISILVFALFILFPLATLAQSPVITITLSTADASPGELFIAPIGPVSPSLIILDNQGQAVYSQALPDRGLDFKRQPNGLISYFDMDSRTFKLLDHAFQPAGQVEAVGHLADSHDLQLSSDGERYLLMIYKPTPYDLSPYGGLVTATVVTCLIQEVNKDDNSLIWEWDALDHIPITYTNRPLTTQFVDFSHCNSLEYDHDGNILVSHRSLDSVTKINRTTDEIIWYLGGVGNDFTLTNDPGFLLQHDARRLWNGRLTLFDNGRASRGYSRAVEYDINEAVRLITRTWEYTGPFAGCCGNVQALPNGNRLINWGNAGQVTEVDAGGVKVFELVIEPGFTYRAFKFPAPFFFPVIFKN